MGVLRGRAATATDNCCLWLDIAKGIGITLVVIGHVDRGLITARLWQPGGWITYWDRVLYSFHMPLFFFLGGLVFRPERSAERQALLLRLLQSIAWPYFIWASIQQVLMIAAAGSTNSSAGWWEIAALPWRPVQQFWFLYAYFLIALSYGLLASHRRVGSFLLLALFFVCWAIKALGYVSSWGPLASVQAYGVYYAAGVHCSWLVGLKPQASPYWLVSRSAWATLGIATIAIVAVGPVLSPVQSLVIAFVGIASIILCAQLVAMTSITRPLARLGEESLAIYVMHTIASAGIRIALVKLAGPVPLVVHWWAGTVAGLALPYFAAKGFRLAGFAWLLRAPTLSRKGAPNRPKPTLERGVTVHQASHHFGLAPITAEEEG